MEHHALCESAKPPCIVKRVIRVCHEHPLRPVAMRLHRDRRHISTACKARRPPRLALRSYQVTSNTHCVLLPCACTRNADAMAKHAEHAGVPATHCAPTNLSSAPHSSSLRASTGAVKTLRAGQTRMPGTALSLSQNAIVLHRLATYCALLSWAGIASLQVCLSRNHRDTSGNTAGGCLHQMLYFP